MVQGPLPQLQQQPDCSDTKLSTDAIYSITTEANVSLEPSSMNMIKVSVQDRLGLPAPKGVRYLFEGGLIQPGVIALQVIMDQRSTIAVMNYTSRNISLFKNIPLGKGSTLSDGDIVQIQDPNHKLDIKDPDIYIAYSQCPLSRRRPIYP